MEDSQLPLRMTEERRVRMNLMGGYLQVLSKL